jgi:glycosyltransferase involved in cell wall biosynthesis
MKVHLYLKSFPPDGQAKGGMEKAVAGLAGGIVAAGGQAVVLCEDPQIEQTILSPDGFEIRCFRDTHKPRAIHIAGGLRDYVSSELNSNSIVVLNAIFHPSVARFAAILRGKRIPYLVAPHDPYHDSIFTKKPHVKWPYWYLIERPMLRGAAAVQVLDERHGQLLRARGVTTPIIEVINGLRESDIPPLDGLSFRSEGRARLLFLGRIDRVNKGLDLLIDAFTQAADHHDIDLTLQGPDAGDLATLQAQASASRHADRITFLPPDFQTSPATLIGRFDLFVISSRFEGFSLAAMEAMLAARPILITDIAGLAPHIRRSGCGTVADATIESLRDAILTTMAQRANWPTMGLAGRTYALEHFRWLTIAAKALADYHRLIPGLK